MAIRTLALLLSASLRGVVAIKLGPQQHPFPSAMQGSTQALQFIENTCGTGG